MDLFLKTETKEQMESSLLSAGFQKEEEQFFKNGCSLLVIGVLQKVVEEEGKEPYLEPLEGFHANVRTEDEEVISSLLPLHHLPKTPILVWLD